MSRLSEARPSEEQRQPPYMTYEEFLNWADEDTLAEWVDGAIVMTGPASRRHQKIVNFLVALLSTFSELHDLGEVIDGPFQMKLGRSGREPDLLFVARAHLERFKQTYLDGPADLVVEVVSPESAGRDRGDKFYEYREAGIPEYWLIDPQLQQAEFYQLDAAGLYQNIAPDASGIYRSRARPGFWLRVGWLWQDPLPDATQALLTIDRDAYTRYLQERLQQPDL
ncbi:MAG TPA: Uma2 family endonuclease [Ktedonobacterales bacterium]